MRKQSMTWAQPQKDGLLENVLAKLRARQANLLIPDNCRNGRLLDIGCGETPFFLQSIEFKYKYGINKWKFEDKRVTAIIVTTFSGGQFIYCYSIDCGQYRLVYEKEVEFVIKEGFDPDFPADESIFDLDYSFYEIIANTYAPYLGYPFCFDDDDDDD